MNSMEVETVYGTNDNLWAHIGASGSRRWRRATGMFGPILVCFMNLGIAIRQWVNTLWRISFRKG